MVTQTTQLKINLPVALKELLESKANRYGLTMTAYIKHLMVNDVQDLEYPEYELSERSEKALKRALKAQKSGKLIEIKDIDEYFKNI